ncbi:hypothetical protein BGY98DRAFT_1141079 [Russula aff. rugulosa BPL654]|nr:hypothetical protein BGY98DRAFT_1141079 [Russula aff. rugulosa BPL654]
MPVRKDRLIIEICTTFQQSTRRNDAALLDSAGVTQVQNSYRHAVVQQNCLYVTRGSATITSIAIGFVIIAPLVFEFWNELSAVWRPALADAMYALRITAYEEMEDLPWLSGLLIDMLMGHDCMTDYSSVPRPSSADRDHFSWIEGTLSTAALKVDRHNLSKSQKAVNWRRGAAVPRAAKNRERRDAAQDAARPYLVSDLRCSLWNLRLLLSINASLADICTIVRTTIASLPQEQLKAVFVGDASAETPLSVRKSAWTGDQVVSQLPFKFVGKWIVAAYRFRLEREQLGALVDCRSRGNVARSWNTQALPAPSALKFSRIRETTSVVGCLKFIVGCTHIYPLRRTRHLRADIPILTVLLYLQLFVRIRAHTTLTTTGWFSPVSSQPPLRELTKFRGAIGMRLAMAHGPTLPPLASRQLHFLLLRDLELSWVTPGEAVGPNWCSGAGRRCGGRGLYNIYLLYFHFVGCSGEVVLGSLSYWGIQRDGADSHIHFGLAPPSRNFYAQKYNHGITAEDEEGIFLALEQRHRVGHLRLYFPVQNLQKLVKAIDGEFPTLEYLIVDRYPSKADTALMLPETLQAPHLQSLEVAFSFPVPNRDVERQLTHTPITTLPNLHFFGFRGVALTWKRWFFMNTTENLRFETARIEFKDMDIFVGMFSREADVATFFVSSVAQISDALSQGSSVVEHLTLEHEVHSQSSEEHNDVDRIEWRNFLRPFGNVKTLRIEDVLVDELSRCLDWRMESLELLPELQELTYIGSRDTGDAFTPFIDTRQNAAAL